ncbi:MAG: hypothetical protein RQ885_05115 [Desulfurococcales archaeon]|nr:hypothetical protein [Desulfurococcales archaeon]
MDFLKEAGIIVALDTSDLSVIRDVVKATSNIAGITGYKVGLEAAITHGLRTVVKTIRGLSNKPIIYDHQKAMNDTPHIGMGFARVLRDAGVDAAIGFPHAGPKTMVTWIEALNNEGIIPIIGGEMTHEAYLRSEGGYICDDAPERIYLEASELGVRHFVLPGNKVDRALRYAEIIAKRAGEPVFLLPGVRMYSDFTRISEEMIPLYRNVHLIFGRALLRGEPSLEALEEMVRKMRSNAR